MGTLDDLFRRFEHLNDIGASLSNERDLNRLLEKIVVAAKSITRADGGTLYLLTNRDATMVLIGPPGGGKSHAACALLIAAIQHYGQTGRYWQCVQDL